MVEIREEDEPQAKNPNTPWDRFGAATEVLHDRTQVLIA
jgi:hypothetical protein